MGLFCAHELIKVTGRGLTFGGPIRFALGHVVAMLLGTTPALGIINNLTIYGAFLCPRFVTSYGAVAKPKKGCPFIK
ncbi:MAG: hypothetical protein MK130_03780 [Puniceicoccaceae bacterium]|nr:hypothetical protein [Puniceicoccaceae bacterium]